MDELLLFTNVAFTIYLFFKDIFTNERIDKLSASVTETKNKTNDIISHIYKDYFNKIKK